MTQSEYERIKEDFLERISNVLREAQIATGYIWMVVPKTGAYRSIKEQHGLYIQPTDGIDNDHDGMIDEADEFVTKADGGQSPHNFNLARDIVPLLTANKIWWAAPESVWKRMADIAVKEGLVAGLYFKSFTDSPHVESARFREVRAAWKAGEING